MEVLQEPWELPSSPTSWLGTLVCRCLCDAGGRAVPGASANIQCWDLGGRGCSSKFCGERVTLSWRSASGWTGIRAGWPPGPALDRLGVSLGAVPGPGRMLGAPAECARLTRPSRPSEVALEHGLGPGNAVWLRCSLGCGAAPTLSCVLGREETHISEWQCGVQVGPHPWGHALSFHASGNASVQHHRPLREPPGGVAHGLGVLGAAASDPSPLPCLGLAFPHPQPEMKANTNTRGTVPPSARWLMPVPSSPFLCVFDGALSLTQCLRTRKLVKELSSR